MKKYGGSAPTCNSKVQEKRIETFRKRKINYPKPLHYLYENTSFDSSWELAVWIWAKDNGFEIEREPITLMYKARDKIRYYLPDFKLNNNLIEVKGDQFFNEQNQLINLYNRQNDDIALAKQDCMLTNSVQIWKFKELKPILEYITKEYGEKHLENFRIKKSF